MSRLTRRRFLQQSAALAAAFAAAGTLPAQEKKSPVGRVNLGLIGVAGRGAENLAGVRDENVNVVALCDVDTARAGKARDEFPRATFTQDYRKLLEQKDVDAVVISTPDHNHAIPAVMAMKLGKHVYCEKPLAHSVHEVRTMMKAAADARVVTQMGTQIHAGDNYRRVVEIVQSGVLGPVKRVHVWCSRQPYPKQKLSDKPVAVPTTLDYDLWLGPAPERPYDDAFVPFHWRWWWDFGGGILADMACHFMDLPHWALGLRTPTKVSATGKKATGGDYDVPDLLQADFHYPARGDRPEVHLTWYSGVRGPDLETKEAFHGFGDGVLFEGEKGQLVSDYNKHLLLPEAQFKDFTPPKETIAKSVGHHREWLDAIRNGGPTTCNFDSSGSLAQTVLLGNVAFRSGETLAWDDKEGTAVGSKAAAKYLRREYRKGWTL
jgi:predicted dehydrogenase